MATDWPDAAIEEVAEKVAMGPFGSSIKVETFVESGVPVISGQHLHGCRLDDGPGFNFITLEHAERLSNANVKRGDVVFTHAGNIGQVAYIPFTSEYARYVISQRQFYMRCDTSSVIPEFVVYYFKTAEGQHKLLANASPSGVPSLAQPVSYLKTIRIPVPPLSEQRAIASTLGALDDKIDLNRRMNETLEAIGRAIFKSWFVDFDPVRAKAEGRQPYGMDAGTAAFFPDAFEDSALGKIPGEWTVARLGDVLELAYGRGLTEANRQPGSIPVYGSNGQVGWHDAPLIRGPGIVVGRKGNPGTVEWVETDFFPIDTTFYVVPRESTDGSLDYLHFALQRLDLPGLSADSAVPGLNRNIAYMSELLLPSPGALAAFRRIREPLRLRCHANEQESRTLADLRDALLPKLLSGEVRVTGTVLHQAR